MSYEEIHAIVEADLGRPVDQIFAEVDEVPLGSASIAQSHWARLATGEQVILKVVKPDIRDLLYRDATLLRITARFLQVIIPRYQPRRVIDEFCEYTLREVEMTLEAENAETFNDNFSDMPDVVFPRIYREFSANNVLCMEYLDGDRPDAEAVTSMPLEERQRLIDLGAEAIIRMLYQDGFFHADLHPANLLVLPEVKVGFLDLGMVGHFDPELRHNLLELFYAMVMEDFEGAARHLAAVSQTDPRSDVPGFRSAVKEVARRWRRQARFEDFSLALLILECIQLGARYHLYFPVEMVLMVKALVTYEGVGYLLDPDFNVAEVSERHIRHIFRQEYSPRRVAEGRAAGGPRHLRCGPQAAAAGVRGALDDGGANPEKAAAPAHGCPRDPLRRRLPRGGFDPDRARRPVVPGGAACSRSAFCCRCDAAIDSFFTPTSCAISSRWYSPRVRVEIQIIRI